MICSMTIPPGEICRYCNQLHSPIVVEIPQGWNKRDVLMPLLIFAAIAVIGIVLWLRKSFVVPSGNGVSDTSFNDGWWFDNGVWRFEDF